MIGLERRGAWFGLIGEDWAPPGVRFMEREIEALSESWGFDSCCESEFETVLEKWGQYVTERVELDRDTLRLVARALGHGSVAPAFAEHVLRDQDHGSEPLASFAAELAHLPGKFAAPARYLQALDSERDGEVGIAEGHLHAAVLADPDFAPALGELARYEADRGNAARAMSLLRRAGSEEDDSELSYLRGLHTGPLVSVGRNDPCPCGSGRKFKACCLNATPSCRLNSWRAGWLYH